MVSHDRHGNCRQRSPFGARPTDTGVKHIVPARAAPAALSLSLGATRRLLGHKPRVTAGDVALLEEILRDFPELGTKSLMAIAIKAWKQTQRQTQHLSGPNRDPLGHCAQAHSVTGFLQNLPEIMDELNFPTDQLGLEL